MRTQSSDDVTQLVPTPPLCYENGLPSVRSEHQTFCILCKVLYHIGLPFHGRHNIKQIICILSPNNKVAVKRSKPWFTTSF